MPSLVVERVEKNVKVENIQELMNESLAKLCGIAEAVLQEHCYAQKLKKIKKQGEKTSMTIYCKQDTKKHQMHKPTSL